MEDDELEFAGIEHAFASAMAHAAAEALVAAAFSSLLAAEETCEVTHAVGVRAAGSRASEGCLRVSELIEHGVSP